MLHYRLPLEKLAEGFCRKLFILFFSAMSFFPLLKTEIKRLLTDYQIAPFQVCHFSSRIYPYEIWLPSGGDREGSKK
jgi:hypothetical protein